MGCAPKAGSGFALPKKRIFLYALARVVPSWPLGKKRTRGLFISTCVNTIFRSS